MYETVDAVRRFDRFPPPEGSERWDVDAVQDVAHDFLAAAGAADRLRRLVVTATDELSFERLVERAIRNHLRMEARRTDMGAVLRALDHAVERDNDIVAARTSTATRTWALVAHVDGVPFSGDPARLVAAAHAVPDVRRARWSRTSTRRAPIAEPESLRRVLHAILDAAHGPVLRRLVAEVMVARFPLTTDPPNAELDDNLIGTGLATPEATAVAASLWEQLNDNERLVTGVLDLPVREMAVATGLSKSTAQRAAMSARAVLSELLTDATDQADIVAALAAASAAVRERGTVNGGSASEPSEEV
jgi:hypothetical protein